MIASLHDFAGSLSSRLREKAVRPHPPPTHQSSKLTNVV